MVSDDIMSIAFINHMGRFCQTLLQISTLIFTEAFNDRVTIQYSPITGANMLQPIIDCDDQTRTTVCFSYINRIWDPQIVDKLQTVSTHHSWFDSRYYDLRALSEGIDELSQDNWRQADNVVYTPFCTTTYHRYYQIKKNLRGQQPQVYPKTGQLNHYTKDVGQLRLYCS